MRAALVVLAILAGDTALAHHAKSGWPYPAECCDDRDCYMMGADLDSHEPEPKYVNGFWILHDGIRIADGDARPSPDGRFHVCRQGGAPKDGALPTGGVIQPANRPPCLYVPRGAS